MLSPKRLINKSGPAWVKGGNSVKIIKRRSADDRLRVIRSSDFQISRMAGFIFARPDSPLAATHILPALDYFDLRSGDHVDFFFWGYAPKGVAKRDKADGYVAVKGVKNRELAYFSAKEFNRARAELESATSWRYSGGVDFMLVDTQRFRLSGETRVDFSSAIPINLPKAIEDKVILGVSQFFEDVFQLAEEKKTTREVSNALGLKQGGLGLIGLALDKFPVLKTLKNLGEYFAVKNIGRDSQPISMDLPWTPTD